MQAEQQSELLPCPFCGHDSPEFERMGTSSQSCIVICGNCGARHESGDEYLRSGSSWNTRSALSHPSPAQGWQPMDDGTMKTIMVQLGAKEVTSEGVVFFRKIEDAVLKVLSARAAGYPAGDGWASAPPPVVQGDKT